MPVIAPYNRAPEAAKRAVVIRPEVRPARTLVNSPGARAADSGRLLERLYCARWRKSPRGNSPRLMAASISALMRAFDAASSLRLATRRLA